MKVCGVAVGDAAGTELGISLVDRYIVDAGTICGRPTGWVSDPVRGQARRRLRVVEGAEAL